MLFIKCLFDEGEMEPYIFFPLEKCLPHNKYYISELLDSNLFANQEQSGERIYVYFHQ